MSKRHPKKYLCTVVDANISQQTLVCVPHSDGITKNNTRHNIKYLNKSIITNPLVVPQTYDGNDVGSGIDKYTGCTGAGFSYYTSGNSENTSINYPGGTVTLSVTQNSGGYQTFSWVIVGLARISKIVVKGGAKYNVYDYSNLIPSPTSDSGLVCPINASGNPADLSHWSFCLDSNPYVLSKSLILTYDKNVLWTLEKTITDSQGNTIIDDVLTVQQNSDSKLYYHVDTTSSIGSIGNYKATIKLIIANPSESILVLNPTVGFNPIVTNNTTINSPPNISQGQTGTVEINVNFGNTKYLGTITIDGLGPLSSVLVPIDFDGSGVIVNTINGNAVITDDHHDIGWNVTYPTNLDESYSVDFDTSKCGPIIISNTATLKPDSGSPIISDTVVVTVNVEGEQCGNNGCTYTIGYWKTHSKYGPAKKKDPSWDNIGEDTIFYLSGKSYYTVINSSSAGGAYYTLARQFIGVVLNTYGGASVPTEVATIITAAEALFSTNTPENVKKSRSLTKQFISYVNTLTSYNEGIIGPGHCYL